MKTLGAGKFKEQCLALLDEVAHEHETIIVTKRGKPVALVSPITESEAGLQEQLKGSILREEDIISPVPIKWEADS
jgi:prevent-host-death family protein